MNKHVFAIGMLLVALGVLEFECIRLRDKLELKELECDAYKFGVKVYKHLYEEEKADTKEA